MKEIHKTMIIGLIFGMVLSLMASIGSIPLGDDLPLWIIPFVTAFLCGLGSIIANAVTKFLNGTGNFSESVVMVIAFISAALINTLVVIIAISLWGTVAFQRELALGAVLGLGMGVAYSLYRHRVDHLEEKMLFLEALADKNRQIQEASRKLAITQERNRMGRELHDSVSQGLHGLVFFLHTLGNEIKDPPQKVSDILAHMEITATSTLDELRAMIDELQPSLLTEEGLEEALQITANLFSQRQETPVEIEVDLPPSLPPELELTIYRITQEALANIEKHAFAQQVQLTISTNDDTLMITITDDGKGFNTNQPPSGNGLRNIRQRVEEAGGVLELTSKPGVGTTVIAKFPAKG